MSAPAEDLTVSGVVDWFTVGTNQCEGWRHVDDLVHVVDNAGAILTVATISTKTTSARTNPESAVCQYQYSASFPVGSSPVYTFALNVDEDDIGDILDTTKKTVSAASVSGGKGPNFLISDI